MEVTLSEKCFKDFLILIHELTGITIASNRTSMVEGRLRKRIMALKLPGYDSYLKLVRDDRAEQSLFIDLVTTNETYFFRTPRIWEFIEEKYLPEWFRNHPKQVFTAWSAAASSGEEACSLGIVCQSFKEKFPGFSYQIIGTDISNEMVGRCQKGLYTGKSIESFRNTRTALFKKYLKSNGEDFFEVLPEIKGRLRFSQHDLFCSHQHKDKFDLVLIRNVLIYFKAEDQEEVLSLIAPKLAEDGIMIIGESESLSYIKTPFKLVEPLIYRHDRSTIAVKAG